MIFLGRGDAPRPEALTVIDEEEQYEYVATAYCRIKEVESLKQKLESLIPEALNCGKDLCDDDDNKRNLNGLEDHLS